MVTQITIEAAIDETIHAMAASTVLLDKEKWKLFKLIHRLFMFIL
jgi:hypothetical protein